MTNTIKTTYDKLKVDDSVTLTLGDTVIHGKVVDITVLGSRKVKIDGNKNTVVLTSKTNFTIETEAPLTAGEALAKSLEVGETFKYLNKYGVVKEWIVTAPGRFTRVDSDDRRPAVSFSAAGFPGDLSKIVSVNDDENGVDYLAD